MNKIMAAVIAGIAVLAPNVSNAATTIYKITKVDTATRTVTLGNGRDYVFEANVALEDIKVGDLVRVTYTTEDGGKNVATAIQKM